MSSLTHLAGWLVVTDRREKPQVSAKVVVFPEGRNEGR